MSGLAAHIAGFGAVGAVPRNMPRLVAVVASLVGRVPPALGAVPRDVPRLLTVVARRLVGALCALASYVPRTITSVATVGFFLAIPGEMARAVAFKTLFSLAAEARVPSTNTALSTLAGEVSRPVALVTNT